ncbi:GAF domain-containing protein [Halovenus sp. WSH3]|uniref:histidine kinase n=1 Tax=Halovenus carboxidivorans TaxID=2692199 RepID=A0A6B0SXT1_9EURY|nr:GAF domain-containing protein [Halovenus carboxidivorans]MXR50344.1 GAF domain-containing protein [Halovenus carboxidivorans]
MHASIGAATVAYVTAAQSEIELDLEATTVSLPAEPEDVGRQLSAEVSCVLVAADIPPEQALATVRAIRRDNPSLPVIAFAGDRDNPFTDRLFQAGVSDVLQSTAEQTPTTLLRRRIEAATQEGAFETERRSLLERYETLLDTAGDAIYQVDLDGYIVEANEASADLLGYDREEITGTHISEFLDEESLRRGQELGRQQLAGEIDDVTTVDLTFDPREGDPIPCRARISAIRENDSVVGWVGVSRDVREQRRREAELERTRELLANAERLGDVGVWELGPDDDRLFWSEGARRIRGASDDLNPTRENVLEFYHPEDRDRISELVQHCEETGEEFSTEARIITSDGEQRWVHLQAEGIETGGDAYNVRGYIQDITERIEREQALQAERDLIEQILEISPIGIVSVDTDGRIVRANEQASEIFGTPERSLEGAFYTSEDLRVFTPDGTELEPGEYPITRILEDGEEVLDERLVVERPDGERRTIALDGVPLREDGEIRQAILTVDDVTEDVERETRLTEQRNELAQLDHINRIIRGVDQALLGAESREEIVQAVCDHLSSSNRYRFAIAVDLVDGRLEPEAWAGPAEEYIETISPTDPGSVETWPATKAIEDQTVHAMQNIADPVEFAEADWQDAALDAGVRSVVAIPIVYEDQSYGAITVYAPFENSFTERELDVLGELGDTVGYAIAAVKRREREEILTSLYETTQDLLAAETEQEVTDAVVDAASEVLEPPGIGIFLFDDDRNVLAPASTTEELMSYYGEATEFGPGRPDAVTWHAYATGETQFYHDIRESDHIAYPETDARSTLLIPLGEHGVFVVSSPERGVFSEEKRRLIGLLATTTEAALDRVAGRADIRERDRELAARAERVDRLEHSLGLLRGTVDLLGQTSTRAELERRTCEQIAAAEEYVFAWIGSVPPDEEAVDPSTWAGDTDGYLDNVSLEFGSNEPAVRAAQTDDPVVVSDATDQLQTREWARQAVDRGVQSVAAVPLVHGETTYGVLAVYASEPDAFDEPVRSVLTQLARTVAYGINAIETSQGVLAEQLTELELSIETPGTFLNAVARVAGQPVTYREITPEPGGSARVLFALDDPPVEEILALESEFVTVDLLTHIERGGEQLFRATLSGQTVAAVLLDCGAIPRRVVAEATETRAVLRLSREIDVRVFLDRVRQQYPDTELLSRKDVERTQAEETAMAAAIEEKLTDRQREVLVTAYESGFFESPRETTGEQLAELLDLSQPTVTHHLREAQRRLYATMLDDE